MSLLLTKNCHYAILVAIEDGQRFKPQSDKDVYVTTRLNLKLPPQVDDLIPPDTRLSTRPTAFTDKPQWRTTLVYYLSKQILSRLRKNKAEITVDIMSLSEKCIQDKLGSIALYMEDAKPVLMRNGARNISQVQQFVVDKGDWLPIPGEPGKIKAGLFVVEMPNNADNFNSNKEFGTPLQMPTRVQHRKNSAAELGLEICSDMSDFFIQSSEAPDDDEDDEDDEDNNDHDNSNEGDDIEEDEVISGDNEDSLLDYGDQIVEDDMEEEYTQIGDGIDKFEFAFRILQAKHIASILDDYLEIEDAYIHYSFSDRGFVCNIEHNHGEWRVVNHHPPILFQGDLQDIKEWLSRQDHIQVCLVVKQVDQDKDTIIGTSSVYLKDRDIGIVQQSSIIYDAHQEWHINSEKQFAKLQYQIGMSEGWDEYKTHAIDNQFEETGFMEHQDSEQMF